MSEPSHADLMRMELPELEALDASDRPLTLPHRRFRGTFLAHVAPLRQRPLWTRLMVETMFRYEPWWVDFLSARWAFVHPRLGAGRFTASVGPSAWRDTRAVALRYDRSRLPGPIRACCTTR